ncbi:coronin-7 isoform X1 [Cimex lectularius]|uniref:Coronin n=1 Tax=Cimex lectularius TaxID=79782 RepID=A0A8I6STX5_CIMLE|nr:coronin-7 isoform X1 [Cimex lectularius]
MAWRFKASKFKNAAPIVPKPEACVRDICVGSYQTYGNNIAASAAFMAFNVDHIGSSLAVLPIDDCGRKSKIMPLLHAHSDTVTDMDFSNFHDGLLATGSQDCLVKVWHIPEKGLEENLSNAEMTFSHRQRRVECVKWHPTVDCLLTTASYSTLTLWDITSEKELYSLTGDHGLIQSISWKGDGTNITFHTKEKTVCVVDPRADKITHSTDSHQSIKDSRVVWLGDTNRILTTGFNSARQREVYIRDLRNFKTTEKTLVLDSSTGILIPLFDPDTSMLFLAGKGDTTISYLEVTDREPFLVEGIRHTGEQTKGACLVPKRALSVMQAEVNRVLQLTSSSVIPIMYQVPRKSYRDFHSELFPNTAGCESKVYPTQWFQGMDVPVPKISLNPADKQVKQVHRGSLAKMCQEIEDNVAKSAAKINVTKPLDPQPKPFRSNISNTRCLFEKDNNEANEIKNKRNSAEIKKEEDNVKIQNGNNEVVMPPKPLPRVSRTGSISEVSDENVPKPVARPRTNSIQTAQNPTPQAGFIRSINISGGYKPRLGPKPFTPPKFNESDDVTEKVGQMALDNDTNVSTLPDVVNTNANGVNGNGEKCLETQPDPNENNDEEDGIVSSTPSPDDPEEGGGDLGRGGVRASIAERRKMYEARSLSMQEPANVSPAPLRRRDSLKHSKTSGSIKEIKEDESSQKPVQKSNAAANAPKRTSTVFGRVSKYRHLKGTPAHKSLHIDNVRNVSRQISGECDGFHCNKDRVAVPLGGPGGKLAVFELNRPGKLPDGVTPTLVNANTIMDFAWDPFNTHRVAVGCDDGTVKIWVIPEGGLTEVTNTPESVLQAHTEKIYCLKYHPLATDILVTTSYDMTIKIWNLSTLELAVTLNADDQIVAVAWSGCGKYIAAASRGSVLSVYEPRVSPDPIRQGKGPGGTRGARLVWAVEGQFIAVMGFDKVSERQIMVFKSDNLDNPLTTVGLDVSPAILIPFYDEDSSTLFLTGRGDSTIYAFQVCAEAPYLNALSHHRCSSLHQGLSFLPKNCCDVTSVEFAKALRLTNTTIEPLSFTVPRIKSDLFQDDLFPDSKVTWEPTMTSEEWINGGNIQQLRISLKPPNMDSLSEAQGTPANVHSLPNNKESKASNVMTGRMPWADPSVKHKQEQIQKSVSSRVEINMKLEQDKMEGVDEVEWNE